MAGRPRIDDEQITVRLTFRVPKNLAEKLFVEANETGETNSERLRKIIEWYFLDEGEK